jgi:hypothetical protein
MNRALGWTISVALLAASPVETWASDEMRGGFSGSERCLLQQGADRLRTPSRACMRCHDGLRGFFAGRRGAHPVEIAYRPSSYGERQMRANPERRALNIALPGGRITCLTCHDPRSRLRWHLAARSDGRVGSRLCDGCHATPDMGQDGQRPRIVAAGQVRRGDRALPEAGGSLLAPDSRLASRRVGSARDGRARPGLEDVDPAGTR